MSHVLEEKKAELKELQNPEESREYKVNPQITLDSEKFEQALHIYAKQLESQNKMNLASILREGKSVLNHNHWSFKVANDLQRNMLERESGMLSFLREQIQQPELFGEIVVDKDSADNQPTIPYTDEEKLREMTQKNPSLAKLQEIFKTRIIYK